MTNYSIRSANNAKPPFSRAANLPTRRRLIGLLTATAAAVLVPFAGWPLTENEAISHVKELVTNFQRAAQSEISDDEFVAEFEKLLGRFGDIPIIARTALGRSWRDATRDQRIEFAKAFHSFLARKYGKILREFASNELHLKSSREVKSFYEVNSDARKDNGQAINIRWLVSDKSGTTKLFDIIIEGVSMVGAERSEIQAMLDKRKGDFSLLIADLNTRL